MLRLPLNSGPLRIEDTCYSGASLDFLLPRSVMLQHDKSFEHMVAPKDRRGNCNNCGANEFNKQKQCTHCGTQY